MARFTSYVRQHHLALIALFVALGGSAYAAAGIGPNDIKKNAVRSRHIKNGQVSVLDEKKTIPSGASITGVFGAQDVDVGSNFGFETTVNFYGLRAPAPLTDEDINFDDEGASATAAKADETSTACRGSVGQPTAPRGKVCIYVISGPNNHSGEALPISDGVLTTAADDRGFVVTAFVTTSASFKGTWAYHAP